MERLARSLNLPGIERFRVYLASLRAGGTSPPPFELLDDPAYSDELPVDVPVEDREFADRLSAAWYLFKRLAVLETDITDRDEGLWAWLSLQLFDQVCPARGDGQRRPGRDYRHIPEFDFRNRHRHLLLGPYQIYRRHGARSMLLLAGPVDSESGLYHEIVSRQDLIANRGVLEAAVMLYLDPKRDRPKPGAQGSHRQPGTVRRFVRVLQQLDVNYDIYGLSGEQILKLLPAEFDVWRPQRDIDFAARAEPVDEWPAAEGM